LEHLRVHAGVHVCVRVDGRATDGVAETHGVRRARPRRRGVPAAVRGVRVRGAGGRHVRHVRGDRPLEADGVGARAVHVGRGVGDRQQHDVHVSGPRTLGRTGVRHRGHGAVPHVPAGHVREAGVARGQGAGRVREARDRRGRVQPDRHVRRLVRRGRRRRLRVHQRVRFGPSRRPVNDGHSCLGHSVPAVKRRRRVDHHQAICPVETLHAKMTGRAVYRSSIAVAVRTPFNDVIILYTIYIFLLFITTRYSILNLLFKYFIILHVLLSMISLNKTPLHLSILVLSIYNYTLRIINIYMIIYILADGLNSNKAPVRIINNNLYRVKLLEWKILMTFI